MTIQSLMEKEQGAMGRKLFESSPGMRLAFLPDSPKFTVIAISKDLCRLFNVDSDRIIGVGYLDACRAYNQAVSSFRVDLINDSIQYVLAHKIEHRTDDLQFAFGRENTPVRKNTWSNVNTPVLNEKGEIEVIINTVEEKDAATESRLRQIFAIDTVGVIYFDLEGRIHDANPAFERMSGYSRADFVEGKVRWDKLTAPEFLGITEKSRQEFLTTWKNTPYEKQYIRPDGSRWWGLFAGKRMSENECVEFVLDITLLKQAEEELERRVKQRTRELECANQELERSNKSLQEFAYAASHDLKEPIRKIQLFIDRLHKGLSERLTPDETASFERIVNATKRMNLLINDLLSYSQVNMQDVDLQEVNLNEIINSVLTDLEVEIESKNAIIEIDNLFTMEGHPRQLQQVFHNVIGNSLKYSKPGVAPFIQIKCRRVNSQDVKTHKVPFDTDYYLISISDNGIGFDQAYAEHIFSVFTRLHNTADFKGTGIGLSITRKVVENHKGFITAEGRMGEGATFNILLPANKK